MALDKLNHNFSDPLKVSSLIVDGTITVAGQTVTGTPVNITDGQSGGKIYVGNTTPSSPTVGDIWIDNTSGSGIQLLRWRRSILTTTTSLFGTDDNLVTLSYTPGNEQVYVNGIMLVRNLDYTATNGQLITLIQSAVAGDVVEVLGNPTFSVTSVYTQSQSDSKYVATNTITAKGDIITGTGYNTYSKTGVGTDGYTLTADSSQANGVSWQPSSTFVAGKNKIINGDFNVWQRGTTFSTSSYDAPVADRFFTTANSVGTLSVTQQSFTPGSAPVTGYESSYFLRYNLSQTGAGSVSNQIYTKIEDVRAFANQTLTFSFWAKASAPYNGAVFIDQFFGTGGSSTNYNTVIGYPNITTSWQRFTVTGTPASLNGKTVGTGSYLRVGITFPANITGYVDTWGWQLESGSVATPFQTASGTYGGELALCQRYYIRYSSPTGTGNIRMLATGYCRNTSLFYAIVPWPVTMRTVPAFNSSNVTSSAAFTAYPGSSSFSADSLSVGDITETAGNIIISGSGLTAGQAGMLGIQPSKTGSYFELSAEL